MLACSSDFSTAAAATVRKPKARVTVVWTDPYIDPSIEASATDNNRVSYPAQVADLIETVPYKWAHLDGVTPLSAGMHPAPGTLLAAREYQVGWWGAARCGVDAVFSVPPVLTIGFTVRPVYSVRVVGDDKWNEYPVDFTVKVYQDTTLLTTITVTGNDDMVWSHVLESAISEATSIKLTITKWSAASRVVKISEFYSSIVTRYDGDDIMSMSILEEMESKDGSLPIGNISANEIDLKLQNCDDKFFPGNTDAPLHTLVKKNRKIIPEIGFELPGGSIEYVPMGVFWSGDWQSSEMGTEASTSGRDRMESLRKSVFTVAEVYENTTLYDLAAVVMAHAKTLMPDLEYNIAAELADFTVPWAWLDKQSHFEALRKIAEASMGRVYCDRLGVVQVLGPSAPTGTAVLAIDADDYFDRNQPAKSEDLANKVEVTTAPLAPIDVAEVYVSKEAITIPAGETVTVTCEYDSKPVIEASAATTEASGGAVVSDAQYYAWGAVVTVYSAIGGSCKVAITGRAFEVVGAETVTAEDADSIRDFGEQVYSFPENRLIQSRAMAQAIASTLLSSYSIPRKDTELEWRGHPALELRDPVQVPEYGLSTGNFYITRQSHTFDGTYKASTEGRKTSELAAAYQDTDGAALAWQDTDNGNPMVQA